MRNTGILFTLLALCCFSISCRPLMCCGFLGRSFWNKILVSVGNQEGQRGWSVTTVKECYCELSTWSPVGDMWQSYRSSIVVSSRDTQCGAQVAKATHFEVRGGKAMKSRRWAGLFENDSRGLEEETTSRYRDFAKAGLNLHYQGHDLTLQEGNGLLIWWDSQHLQPEQMNPISSIGRLAFSLWIFSPIANHFSMNLNSHTGGVVATPNTRK